MMNFKWSLFVFISIFVSVLVFISYNTDNAESSSDSSVDDDSLGLDDSGVDTSSGDDTDNGSDDPVILSEFQIEACNAADSAGTCDTKLRDLGIVSKSECCRSVSKCC